MITGLGLAVQPSGVRTFVLNRMVRGRRRYATVGNADTMTVPEARAEARRLIASFIEPAKAGDGPRTPGRPMDAFAGEFLERQSRLWKPATVRTNTHIVRNHILPAFGHMTVDAIAVEHVRDSFASLADRPGIANRAMPLPGVHRSVGPYSPVLVNEPTLGRYSLARNFSIPSPPRPLCWCRQRSSLLLLMRNQ